MIYIGLYLLVAFRPRANEKEYSAPGLLPLCVCESLVSALHSARSTLGETGPHAPLCCHSATRADPLGPRSGLPSAPAIPTTVRKGRSFKCNGAPLHVLKPSQTFIIYLFHY